MYTVRYGTCMLHYFISYSIRSNYTEHNTTHTGATHNTLRTILALSRAKHVTRHIGLIVDHDWNAGILYASEIPNLQARPYGVPYRRR